MARSSLSRQKLSGNRSARRSVSVLGLVAAMFGGALAMSPQALASSSATRTAGPRTWTGTAPAGGPERKAAWLNRQVSGGEAARLEARPTKLYSALAVPSSPSAPDTPPPTLDSVSPSSVNAGCPAILLTVTGTGFTQQSEVRLGTDPLPTIFSSPTRLTAVIPSVRLTTAGILPVTVATPSAEISNALKLAVEIAVTVSPASKKLKVNGEEQFRAKVDGSTNQSVNWLVNGVTGGDRTVGTIDSMGLYKAPAKVPSPDPVTVAAVSQADTTKSASAQVILTASAVTVSVSPSPASVQVGATQQFTATVTGSGNTAVVWQVNGVTGGNSTVGTISVSGLYHAPASVPNPATVTVTAVSQVDNSQSGSAAVTITTASAIAVAISPTSASVQVNTTWQFTATVVGTTNVAVTWQVNGVTGGNSTAGTISASGLYLAPASVPSPATVTVRAVSQADNTKTASASVTVTATTGISVSVSPSSVASLQTGLTQQFTATVSGISNHSVLWQVNGITGGSTTLGTISVSGLYKAPAYVPNPPTITVWATSAVDSTKNGQASVGIISPVEDWPKYRRDLANTGRSAETGLSSANASLLKKKWTFTTGGKVSASPAVATVNGTLTVFVGAWNGVFYAIDAVAGTQLWSFTIDAAPGSGTKCINSPASCTRIASSPAVSNGNVYFGAGNGFVYALNAATGAKVWGVQVGDATQGAEVWASPAVFNGEVYIGLASHDDTPCVAGQVLALNAATGNIDHTFNVLQGTCPVPGTCVGGGMWSSPAIDTVNSVVYYGSGNPGNGCVPATQLSSISYTDGILALGLDLSLLGFYQAMASDPNDAGDFGSSAVLHSTSQCTSLGNSNWVTEAEKNGSIFTFPIGSGGFLNLTPSQILLNSGELIASPAALPGSASSSCNHFYLPTEDGFLYDLVQAGDGTGNVSVANSVAINVSGGCATPGNCPLFSAPASIADILLFGGGEGNFYAYSTSGQRLFSFGTLGLVASGPAISHSRVYLGSYDKNVYCLSIQGQ